MAGTSDRWQEAPHRHTGIDLPYPASTPVYATADGVVDQLVSDQTGLGLAVITKHSSGYESVYGHLSASTVRAGNTVLRGAMIGRVGSTGRSTGPHLHYAILYLGKPVNPEHYCLLWLTVTKAKPIRTINGLTKNGLMNTNKQE